MRFDTIGPLGVAQRFTDERLVSSTLVKLFAIAIICVVTVTPVLFGWVDAANMPSWFKFPWQILRIAGPISMVFSG